MFNEIKETAEFKGANLELSTGKIANQADGAVVVRIGETFILSTTVFSKSPKDDVDFFPLTVNYQEKTHAVGRIPGGFLKREGKGGDKEILVSRLIDRSLRPMFAGEWFNETNILSTVNSHDANYPADILALIGASASLAISGAPYQDIVAASRVGKINGKFVLNPSSEEIRSSSLDLVVAGTRDSLIMVESEADFLSEEEMLEAVKFGHEGMQPIITCIENLQKKVAKPKAKTNSELYPSTLKDEIKSFAKDALVKAFALKEKKERYKAIDEIALNVKENFVKENISAFQVKLAFGDVKSDILRSSILNDNIRIDGRAMDEIRSIDCEVGLLAKAHGSALFTRGETQALVSTTLGTSIDSQFVEDIDGEYKEYFLLNYIFPSYSVGETGQLRAPSRREVGHAKLAWRALKRSLPNYQDFPYTLRIVSEITACNGSSSMATICGSSMSLMQAGVPLRAPIAGIAMGLIKDDNKFVILSDILGDEDHLGDMDFKVAGGENGITALQMDIKILGITYEIMEKALAQAKKGRVHILSKMSESISSIGTLSEYAPIMHSLKINKDKIRELIGPGGKIIKEICETTSSKIEVLDSGDVTISAVGKENLDAAISKVRQIVFDPEIGDVFVGRVVKMIESGVFVNYLGSRDGFVHISEIAEERIKSVSDVLSEGQEVKIKLLAIERGKTRFTIKGADKEIVVNSAAQTPAAASTGPSASPSAGPSSPVRKEAKKFQRSSVKKIEPKKRSEEDSEEEVVERKYFS